MNITYEYRAIGINISKGTPPNPNNDVEKLKSVSKDFLEKEFRDYYQNKSGNISLQCQNLINIYGKRGWEHYFQGQIDSLIIFYFRRSSDFDASKINDSLNPEEEALMQCLDQSQLP